MSAEAWTANHLLMTRASLLALAREGGRDLVAGGAEVRVERLEAGEAVRHRRRRLEVRQREGLALASPIAAMYSRHTLRSRRRPTASAATVNFSPLGGASA